MTAPRVVTQVKEIAQANETRFLCPHCNNSFFVQLDWPYGPTPKNQERKREAIEEHRRNCSGAPPEAGRVFSIDYPRK